MFSKPARLRNMAALGVGNVVLCRWGELRGCTELHIGSRQLIKLMLPPFFFEGAAVRDVTVGL